MMNGKAMQEKMKGVILLSLIGLLFLYGCAPNREDNSGGVTTTASSVTDSASAADVVDSTGATEKVLTTVSNGKSQNGTETAHDSTATKETRKAVETVSKGADQKMEATTPSESDGKAQEENLRTSTDTTQKTGTTDGIVLPDDEW